MIAADRRSGLLSVVQLEESSHNRGAEIRIPGLDPATSYRLTWATPILDRALSGSQALDPTGPTGGIAVPGAAPATIGFVMPRRLPATAQLIELLADNRRPQPA